MSDVPDIIQKLVNQFHENRDQYLSAAYNEEQTRAEFITPFFEALGWDVTNKAGNSPAYMDVVFEGTIRVEGAANAPDYTFRVGQTRKFFVEAKKPDVRINFHPDPARQIRRYSWTAKLPLGVLTNFAELAVYDCRIPPRPSEQASYARLKYIKYTEYPQRWDEIASIFSKDAVWKGSFDKYAVAEKGKRGTAEVDQEFLKQIEEWRTILARNLALRNPRLDVRELNFAVQSTIDRIVFLRMCEDRGIEPQGQLLGRTSGPNIHGRLVDLYISADHKYNSGLFHFSEEKGRVEPPDTFTPALKIDDKVLKDMIAGLYYPKSPYEFSVIGADILGSVYEQFLGKVIRLTPAHTAVVDEKPEVKKAGGVYYTPTYIVDYIVKNTVGKLCEGSTPKQVEKLRILDPACGSGSFLIDAYALLLNWHLDYYVKNDPMKHKKEIYRISDSEWRLTTKEKKRILLNNIYGVDIDSQAVEVTKLSLLLKVLEGESRDTLDISLSMFHERALPDLANNIKCGNSLIGSDFFEGRPPDEITEEERSRINAFDWASEFPAIMGKGGFDAVIGNPPWGAGFSDGEREYLRSKYRRVVARTIDSYIYFIDHADRLAKPGGPVGLIIPSTILNQIDAKPVRSVLLDRGLSALLSLGQEIFGRRVLNTSTIFISVPRQRDDGITLTDLSEIPLQERSQAIWQAPVERWSTWAELVRRDPHFTFFAGNPKTTAVLSRMREKHAILNDVVAGSIERGVSPDVAPAHIVSGEEVRQLEPDLLRPSISGTQVRRYRDWSCDQFIIYTTRTTPIDKYPKTLAHLRQFRQLNTCKEVTAGKHPWWALHRPRNAAIFESPKFIGLTTSKTIEMVYDARSGVYVTDAMYVFRLHEGHDPCVFLGIVQSRAFLFLYRVSNQGEMRVIPQVKASKLQNLPYPSYDDSDPRITRLAGGVNRMLDLHKKLDAANVPGDKTAIQRQIDATDDEIDNLVYALYGLTDEEIEIVKAAT